MLAAKHVLVTPEEYLASELHSDTKREYVAGIVYAMAGAKNRNNEISGNVFAALHSTLRGKPCRPYNGDTKVRVRLRGEVRFYYADALVTCKPNAPGETFQDHPSVLVEVLSESTRRIDEGEKRDAYLSIPSLTHYLLVEPEEAVVIVYRRAAEGFVREAHLGLDAVVALDSIGAMLPLRDVYEGVDLV